MNSFLARAPSRRDDVRVVAVSFDDGHRFVQQLRLAAQPGGERKHRDEEAGDARHPFAVRR